MTKIVLKNGEVASSAGLRKADVLFENGKILEVGENLKGDKEYDCTGKLILPGAIDVHVHFREPGQSYKEDWECGSGAAAAGGVTTVFDMPNNQPPIISVQTLEEKRTLIKGRSHVNYGIYMGFNGENAGEINKAENIPGVKIYCAHSTGNMGVGPDYLEDAFTKINRDKLLLFHSEDEACIAEHKTEVLARYVGRDVNPAAHTEIRHSDCALMMTKKLCELAKKHERKIHVCHVSTEAEVDLINEYKEFVTCEVAPHHLTLSEDDYEYLGNFVKMNPPVRGRFDVFGLWKCVKAGMVDIIATDHAPHTVEEKEQEYGEAPSGVPGVEMMVPILLNAVNNEGMTIAEVVKLCCEGPAEIFQIPGKGKVEVGFDADLMVVDMDLEKELKDEDVFTKCGWSPYSGSVFKGWPIRTFVAGELVFEEGKVSEKFCGEEISFA